MKDKLDYYDCMAIVAPGVVCIILFLCILKIPTPEGTTSILNISLGSSLLLLVSSYFAGELLQCFGKLVELIFWWPHGGRPLTWICETKHNFIVKWARSIGNYIIPTSKINIIKNNVACNGKLSAHDVNANFSKIKLAAYNEPEAKETIVKLLSKANMCRGFFVVALLFILYFICTSEVHFGLNAHSLILTSAMLVAIMFLVRYRYYSIKYASFMLTAYVSHLERTAPPVISESKLAIGAGWM